MTKEKRFYIATSHLYGDNTVYDRESQTPAFELGAKVNMNFFEAARLVNKLNRLARTGDISSLNS